MHPVITEIWIYSHSLKRTNNLTLKNLKRKFRIKCTWTLDLEIYQIAIDWHAYMWSQKTYLAASINGRKKRKSGHQVAFNVNLIECLLLIIVLYNTLAENIHEVSFKLGITFSDFAWKWLKTSYIVCKQHENSYHICQNYIITTHGDDNIQNCVNHYKIICS